MANRSSLVVLLLFVPIMLATCLCFGIKFWDLICVAAYEPDGAFAVTPIMNYLLAGIGFLLMLGWAACNGMFRDIERPKITMLENEERLDAMERNASHRSSKGSS